MSTSKEICGNEALLCDCSSAIRYTCAYKFTEITSVVYERNAENELVSRIKMADYRALVSMGAL